MGSGFSKRKKEAKMLHEQLAKAQDTMRQSEVRGQAGNGLVQVVMTGDYTIKSLKINPQCVDPEDVEGLEDLIKAALKEALEKLQNSASAGLPAGLPEQLKNLSGLGGLGSLGGLGL
jgi:DNA-binding YbaB/EbfC family protein